MIACGRYIIFYSWLSLLLASCQSHPSANEDLPLFSELPADYTGIDFRNDLTYTEEFNVYTYRNFYNGGGVGIGDINNDGLADIFFCGNQADNRLYLNKGDFKFEDITEKAGVASSNVWSTGVSFADVNGDGWLDIYVCKSGDIQGENRHNELFINNGDLTFKEQAHDYRIADKGLSTHAAFLDYDLDGDLDCYLLNNSFRPVGGYDIRPGQREIRDTLGGNKLYRNDGDYFTDVSEAAGIYGSMIGFGLGVTVGDVNRDGWPDMFVSNDFFEKDYLYINQKDGTFAEVLESQIREISMGSMGADMADINNDGYPEIYVTDMLPEDDARMKTKTNFENWDKYQLNVRNGFYHQFTRNVLQLNNTNGTFSEISRYANVYATDWSWGALMADFDNDGHKDIFVANGIYKDLTDQDYINFMGNPETVRAILKRENAVIKKLVDSIPSERLPNYMFVNQGDLTFENEAVAWGLGTPSHSNGSAYGDLDNDGDLDLVINNVNMPPFVYRNNTDSLYQDRHYLQVQLRGDHRNPFALGAQVSLRHEGQIFYQELAPMRGFESTVDYKLTFGLGEITRIDTLEVRWLGGRTTLKTDVPVDQLIELHQTEAEVALATNTNTTTETPLFQARKQTIGLDFQHQENDFIDFDRDQLLYHMLSTAGPCSCQGDINGDKREDIYVGGAKDQAGQLFLQDNSGRFHTAAEVILKESAKAEDTDCAFFDADQDGDLDLYVASGGSEFSSGSSALRDRLYLNDGRGKLTLSEQFLPVSRYESTACVKPADYDGDGDIDLFIGIRLQTMAYGFPSNGYLLENEAGTFTEVSKRSAPDLTKIGMITDATWLDIDQDQDLDLVVIGDWMPITIFVNDEGFFTKSELPQSSGFWNRLAVGDFNGDGLADLVLGNHGKNTRLKASIEQPMSMYVADFDKNGKAEQIVCVYNGAEAYPLALRHDLVKQIPTLKKKYLYYKNYREQTITDIFPTEEVKKAIHHQVFITESVVLMNQGEGKFSIQALPYPVQFAPVYGLLVEDFTGDGQQDILLGGNFHHSKPELGIYDASYGMLLEGDGKGGFKALPTKQSGISVRGEVRDIIALPIQGEPHVIFAKNDDQLEIYSY